MNKFVVFIYNLLGLDVDEEDGEEESKTLETREKTPKVKSQLEKNLKEKVIPRNNVILVLMNPRIKDDARRAVNLLKENNLVLADFESGNADKSILSYFVAYLSGAVDAIGGVADKFGEYVYLFTPPGVSITREQKKDIIDGSVGESTPPFSDL